MIDFNKLKWEAKQHLRDQELLFSPHIHRTFEMINAEVNATIERHKTVETRAMESLIAHTEAEKRIASCLDASTEMMKKIRIRDVHEMKMALNQKLLQREREQQESIAKLAQWSRLFPCNGGADNSPMS